MRPYGCNFCGHEWKGPRLGPEPWLVRVTCPACARESLSDTAAYLGDFFKELTAMIEAHHDEGGR